MVRATRLVALGAALVWTAFLVVEVWFARPVLRCGAFTRVLPPPTLVDRVLFRARDWRDDMNRTELRVFVHDMQEVIRQNRLYCLRPKYVGSNLNALVFSDGLVMLNPSVDAQASTEKPETYIGFDGATHAVFVPTWVNMSYKAPEFLEERRVSLTGRKATCVAQFLLDA